jgi:hypothetical protein
MASRFGFLTGVALVVLVGACAPRSEPVSAVFVEPVYTSKYGVANGEARCPPGTVRTTTAAAPERIVCRVPPEDCDDPFWRTQSSVPLPPHCLPPRERNGNDDSSVGERNGDDDTGREPPGTAAPTRG